MVSTHLVAPGSDGIWTESNFVQLSLACALRIRIIFAACARSTLKRSLNRLCGESENMNEKMNPFQAERLDSVRGLKARRGASSGALRATGRKPTAAALARASAGLSQSAFAALLGVSTRTLQDWEQGRRHPTGAAQSLLRVAVAHPEALRDLQSA
jgi:putative transcriptional regulator